MLRVELIEVGNAIMFSSSASTAASSFSSSARTTFPPAISGRRSVASPTVRRQGRSRRGAGDRPPHGGRVAGRGDADAPGRLRRPRPYAGWARPTTSSSSGVASLADEAAHWRRETMRQLRALERGVGDAAPPPRRDSRGHLGHDRDRAPGDGVGGGLDRGGAVPGRRDLRSARSASWGPQPWTTSRSWPRCGRWRDACPSWRPSSARSRPMADPRPVRDPRDPRDASQEDIERAYRRLARSTTPT